MVEFVEGTDSGGNVLGRGPVRAVSYGTDDNLYVEFYKNPVDGEDHIKMLIPGDKTFKPDFVVTEQHKRRFPRQWDAYQNEKDQFAGQTRLEEIAWVDPGTRDHLKGLGIHTVEQLAGVLDTNLHNVGHGARDLRTRAQKEMATLQNAKAYEEAQAEKDAMQSQIDELKSMVEQLTAPKKIGRPRKEAANG